MRPEPPPDVIEYIRANRGVYTRAAIERELLEAGHSQEAIAAAWRAFPAEGAAAEVPDRSVVATVQFWLLLFAVACVALTVMPILMGVLASFLVSVSGIDDNGPVFLLVALAPYVLGYLLIGVGGWLLLRRDRAAALGVFSGLAVAFVLAVIVAGACVAILTQW